MKSRLKKNGKSQSEVVTGLFSKAEAADLISKGIRHLHSSILGALDPCAQTTNHLLSSQKKCYSWDLTSASKVLRVTRSSERSNILDTICSTTAFGQRTQNRNSLKQILEELLTNAIYHAYKESGSKDKYHRLISAHLSQDEEVSVRYAENSSGLFLSVEDQGGKLRFDSIASCLKRCYSQTHHLVQIEQKHEGAGLGLYFIFELSTHMSVFVKTDESTRFVLWIASSGQADPDNFSFNFFEES